MAEKATVTRPAIVPVIIFFGLATVCFLGALEGNLLWLRYGLGLFFMTAAVVCLFGPRPHQAAAPLRNPVTMTESPPLAPDSREAKRAHAAARSVPE